MKYLVLSLTLGFALVSGSASADIIQNPTTGTVEAALLDGLKLVKNGKFDDWVSKYCSKEKACATSDSVMSYKRFNLTMMRRRAPACLRENDTALDIDRVLDESDGSKSIYLRCEATTSPVRFNLIKEGDSWRFSKI